MTKYIIFTLLAILCVAVVGCRALQKYEKAYKPTSGGDIEIKKLPEARVLAADGEGTYFETDDALFMQLFKYIKNENVAMTVPVEADVESAQMRFYTGRDVRERELPDRENVQVHTRSGTTVASLGLRGAYTREVFETGREELAAWLRENPQWQPAGDAYAVYWNGPFVPNALKRSEVHIPVVPADGGSGTDR